MHSMYADVALCVCVYVCVCVLLPAMQAELGPPPQVGESTSGQDRIEGAPNES